MQLALLSLVALVSSQAPAPPPDAASAAPAPAAPPSAVPAADAAPASQGDALARAEHALLDEKDDAASYNKALAAYDEANKVSPLSAESYCKRAEAFLRLGDLAKGKSEKQGFYKKGQDEAETGLKLDKRNARCHFWRSANLGRWGEQKGVLNALFLLDEVKGGFKTALELDPNNVDAKLALGKVDELVPGFAGGSKERAEKAFRDVIKANPTYGRAKLNLAEMLVNDDREDEAKKLSQEVLDEKKPMRPGEHRKFDIPRAKRIIAQANE